MKEAKRGILVTSFGTTYADTRATAIETCENTIASAFPDFTVRRSFTSYMIIKRLRLRDGIEIPTPEEALKSMLGEGFTEVVVQPLHIIPGEEFHEKIVKKAIPYKSRFNTLRIGRPLLFYERDYQEVAAGIKAQLPGLNPGEGVVFVGHGTSHPANACYSCLQSFLQDEDLPVFIGNVEGYPEIDRVIKRLKKADIKEVTLMPFMLVAGDHARKDMAGEDESSWKSILEREGFKVEVYLHGLGENEAFRLMYVDRVKDALNEEASCI